MNTVLFKCVARKLILVRRERLLPFDVKVYTDRVRRLINQAMEYGVVFEQPHVASNSLPNLVANIQSRARYSAWEFEANISCWSDGEVVLSIIDPNSSHSDSFLWMRVYKNDLMVDSINFHSFLKKGVSHAH